MKDFDEWVSDLQSDGIIDNSTIDNTRQPMYIPNDFCKFTPTGLQELTKDTIEKAMEEWWEDIAPDNSRCPTCLCLSMNIIGSFNKCNKCGTHWVRPQASDPVSAHASDVGGFIDKGVRISEGRADPRGKWEYTSQITINDVSDELKEQIIKEYKRGLILKYLNNEMCILEIFDYNDKSFFTSNLDLTAYFIHWLEDNK